MNVDTEGFIRAVKETPGMVGAELTKLRRRGFATAAVVVALVHGGLALLSMGGFRRLATIGATKAERAELNPFDGLQAGEWTLFGLCLPVMIIVLLSVVAQLFAGEYAQRTYSLLLVRPVARWRVFLNKFVAAFGFVVVLFLAAAVIATLLGLAGFGAGRETTDEGFWARLLELVVWFLGAALSMLPLIAVTAFFAVVTRSTALSITYTIILWLIDATVGVALHITHWARKEEIWETLAGFTMTASRAPTYERFLNRFACEFGLMIPGVEFECPPGSAWAYLADSAPSYGLMFGYTALFVVAAIVVFTFQDVE